MSLVARHPDGALKNINAVAFWFHNRNDILSSLNAKKVICIHEVIDTTSILYIEYTIRIWAFIQTHLETTKLYLA